VGHGDQERLREVAKKIAVSSLMTRKIEQQRVFRHLARGGLRGLKVLSLAECKNFSDLGLQKMKELKFIKSLNLLGCTRIEDAGVKHIIDQFHFLQELDLGGCGITQTGLRDLAERAPNLKTVSIMGCKKLNNSDDQILLKRHIAC